MCWNITRVSLWLLCDGHFVRCMKRTRLQTRPFVRGINSLPKLGVCASRNQHVCGKNLNIISMCAVSPVVYTSKISCWEEEEEGGKKKSFPVTVNNSIKVGHLVFLL